MNTMPIRTIKNIFHVGYMDKSLKKQGSLEGSGLSISTEPYAWVKINPFTGGKLFELKKEGNQFLDYHKLSNKQTEQIMDWGVQEGYIERCPLYYITYYDDEMDMDLTSIIQDKSFALEEAESYGVPLEEKPGFISTPKMDNRVMSLSTLLSPISLLTTIYVEDVLNIDGVWWDEELDVSRYSAPRGVIVNPKLNEWDIILISDSFY